MHLMIDLETLGTNTDCVVTQIGFAVFELKANIVSLQGGYRPDPNEQIFENKRTITWDTFKWWMCQSNEARESMIINAEGPMRDCLWRFLNDIETQFGWSNIEGVWSHGISFDIVIMEHLFRQYKIKCPWKYNTPRDTRTIFMLVPDMAMEKPLVAHNAMDDAVAQALNIQKALKFITVNKDA